MNFQKLFSAVLITFLISACSKPINRSSKDQIQLLRVVKPTYKFKKYVSFSISNSSQSSLLVESTVHFYIERFNDQYNRWDKIPYQPCKCGTPCSPPSSKKLASGETISITWNRESVNCAFEEDISETITNYQEKGLYRMIFVYNPIVDNKKTGREQLIYEFILK